MDPISRDVERRLSMKFDRSFIKELPSVSFTVSQLYLTKLYKILKLLKFCCCSDDSLSGHSSIRSSSIDHAKVLAKTASNYASSIFRGAINKVKQVAHTGFVSHYFSQVIFFSLDLTALMKTMKKLQIVMESTVRQGAQPQMPLLDQERLKKDHSTFNT